MDLNNLTQLYIFEPVPQTQGLPGIRGWWSNTWGSVQQGKYVPYAFARGVRLIFDVVMLCIAIVISTTMHAPGLVIAGAELLFLATAALFVFSRAFRQFSHVVMVYLAIICLCILLNLFFPGRWGNVGLYMLSVILLYRFPPSWSLPLAGLSLLSLIVSDGVLPLLNAHQLETLIPSLLLTASLCWFGWTQRVQYLLIVRLHEVQEQLREQMVRSEALAAEHERARIARDIHDVLSHSLAVLSIQVQAARQLLTRDPERLAVKLEDMATLIRESITESRRVVGLLREQQSVNTPQDDLGTGLRSITATFNERTGIRCRFEEEGTPYKVRPQQRETLELALREMLTNAHRHGAAQTVWITLRWQDTRVMLETRDDEVGAKIVQAHDTMNTAAHSAENGVGQGTGADATGGHHGLQGMRERATALGGEVAAGPGEEGGFVVSISLPYEQSGERLIKKGSPGE